MKAKKICAAAKMAAGVVTGYPKAIVEGASDLMGERLKEKTMAYIEENVLPEEYKKTLKVATEKPVEPKIEEPKSETTIIPTPVKEIIEEVKEEVKEHFPLLSRLFKIMS